MYEFRRDPLADLPGATQLGAAGYYVARCVLVRTV